MLINFLITFIAVVLGVPVGLWLAFFIQDKIVDFDKK